MAVLWLSTMVRTRSSRSGLRHIRYHRMPSKKLSGIFTRRMPGAIQTYTNCQASRTEHLSDSTLRPSLRRCKLWISHSTKHDRLHTPSYRVRLSGGYYSDRTTDRLSELQD